MGGRAYGTFAVYSEAVQVNKGQPDAAQNDARFIQTDANMNLPDLYTGEFQVASDADAGSRNEGNVFETEPMGQDINR